MVLPNQYTSDATAINLTSNPTNRFAAWYDVPGELRTGRQPVAGGTWTIHKIAGTNRTALALPVKADPHNYPAIAQDGAGRLHLWANMHNNPLRYLVSASAASVTTWAPGTLPGVGKAVTYPIPIRRPDGSLRLFLRDGPVGSGAGRADCHFWDYGLASTAGQPTLLFQGLLVDGGSDYDVDDTTNWSAYPAIPVVTGGATNWIEHWSWIWRGKGTEARSNTLPSYMQYRSATKSWHAADGTPVTLPVTPLNNPATRTGMVSDGEGYLNFGGLAIDDNGRPHLVISQGPRYHIEWDGTAWKQTRLANTLNGLTAHGRFNCYWLNGSLWVLGVEYALDRPRLWRISGNGSDGSVNMGGQVPDGLWECAADPEALRRRGRVEVLTPDGDAPLVFSSAGVL